MPTYVRLIYALPEVLNTLTPMRLFIACCAVFCGVLLLAARGTRTTE
jgi:hypothetical protein